MTSYNSSIYLPRGAVLAQEIQEFEYRKAATLTFFERCCAKKTFMKRREVFLHLTRADEDVEEGFLHGYHAPKSFAEIGKMGFSEEWTKSLEYAYWFSSLTERKTFQNHILGGVVASRSELKRPRPKNDFQDCRTSILGRELYSAQNDLVWKNALTMLLSDKTVSPKQVVRVVQNAQDENDRKGLKAGITALTVGLIPLFFREEEAKLIQDKSSQSFDKILHDMAQKQKRVLPYLKSFAWLYLSQGKYYQDLELRNCLDQSTGKLHQMPLPLSTGRERAE